MSEIPTGRPGDVFTMDRSVLAAPVAADDLARLVMSMLKERGDLLSLAAAELIDELAQQVADIEGRVFRERYGD